MSRSRLVTLFVFTIVFFLSFHFSISSDTWWHLSAGRWMVENQTIIQKDVFSYTRVDTPWRYPGPWIQILMYLLYDAGGATILSGGVALVLMITWYVVWRQMEGLAIVKALLLILSASSAYFYYVARPFLITFLLFSLFLLLFREREMGRKRYFWLIYPLMVVWVNSHGGFIAGFLIWGVYLVNSLIQWISVKFQKQDAKETWQNTLERIINGFLLIGASLINPLGSGVWRLFFSTVSRQAEKLHIFEWKSPDFHSSLMAPFLILILVSIVVLGFAKRVKFTDVLLLCGFLALGLVSIRNIFFFSITAAVLLSDYASNLVLAMNESAGWKDFTDWDAPSKGPQLILNIVIAGLLVGLIGGWIMIVSSREGISARMEVNFPVEAVSYIQEAELPQRIFNSYNHGGYLIWALPEFPVFIDGRADLYQDELFFEWYSVVEGDPGWQQILEKWDIGFIMIEPFRPLAKHLSCYGWQEVYSDDLAVIFLRGSNMQPCNP